MSIRSGAVEAWRAHNPQVPRSKLGSEIIINAGVYNIQQEMGYLTCGVQVASVKD